MYLFSPFPLADLFPEPPTCTEDCQSTIVVEEEEMEDFSSVSIGTIVGAVLGATAVVAGINIGVTLLCVRSMGPSKKSDFRWLQEELFRYDVL